ncbi:MAG: histidine phosphatase family protein [Acidobacteriaceae bacterium]
MILYFLRHANAGEKKKDPEKDELRGLDGTGVGQCYQAARLFSRLEVVPDLIISSPLKRAMQTAALVANEIGYDDRLRVEKSLRPEAHWEDFVQKLKSYKVDVVIVVGHSPNLSQFLGRMISKAGGRAAIDLKKGGIARAEYDGRSGELQWLLTPKFIREANAASHVEGIAPVALPVSAFSFDQKTKKKEKPAKPKSGRGKRRSNSKQHVSKKK